jgi:predicted  nucleic acid-binding Zn-ribbon protein
VSSVKEQLIILMALQKREIEISRIENELAGIDARVEAMNTELLETQTLVSDQEQKLDTLKKQYRSNENEVQMVEAQIVKSKEKLRAVKTNKEYQSTLKEIDDLKEKASNIEDWMLADLDDIEVSEKKIAELQADLADVQSEVEQKRDEIRKKADMQLIEVESLKKERMDIWGKMEPKLQIFYDKIKRQGQGIAIAAIVEGVCQVCRMNIPPQLFNELMRMDSLRMCPNCQRVMYPKAVIDER